MFKIFKKEIPTQQTLATPESTALPCCEFPGCAKQVSKPGYTLCYEHWQAARAAASAPKKAEAHHDAKCQALLSSTSLGEKFGLSGQKINQVLSELGWIQRETKGWSPTELGSKLCAEVKKHHQTGIPFVLWPEAILTSRILVNTIKELQGEKPAISENKIFENSRGDNFNSFREKFTPTHRATDGHWVRSKAEMLIDNWLYMSGLVHAYERLLPVEEDLYCDFYIPAGKVYIEYWGLENDPKYAARKKVKQEIYKKYNFNLIELNDDYVRNLDDCLPKMLLKFNVIAD